MCKISEIISNVTASVETINKGKHAWIVKNKTFVRLHRSYILDVLNE